MKIYLKLTLLVLIFSINSSCNQNQSKKPTDMTAKVLKHIVLFKFKEEAKKEDVDRLNKAFNELPEKINVIKDFKWGINDSPEDLHQDFTHCYVLTFQSEKDRDEIYSPHEEHQAFVAMLQPHLEKVLVVDFWAHSAGTY